MLGDVLLILLFFYVLLNHDSVITTWSVRLVYRPAHSTIISVDKCLLWRDWSPSTCLSIPIWLTVPWRFVAIFKSAIQILTDVFCTGIKTWRCLASRHSLGCSYRLLLAHNSLIVLVRGGKLFFIATPRRLLKGCICFLHIAVHRFSCSWGVTNEKVRLLLLRIGIRTKMLVVNEIHVSELAIMDSCDLTLLRKAHSRMVLVDLAWGLGKQKGRLQAIFALLNILNVAIVEVWQLLIIHVLIMLRIASVWGLLRIESWSTSRVPAKGERLPLMEWLTAC